jgi:hypothetical protein
MDIRRDISGLDGYQCSDTGIVYRLNPRGECREKSTWLRKGCLYITAHGQDYSVHRLVLATFVGPCPYGATPKHIDGNKRNNALANLKYVPRVLVKRVKRRRELHRGRGRRDGLSQLSPVLVAYNRRMLEHAV